MKPNAKILEQNIARLIQRAYVPAQPASAFRAGLRHCYLERFNRLHAEQPTRRKTAWRSPLLLAAAGLLLMLLASRALKPAQHNTPSQILGQAQVALAFDSAPWRAASPTELSQGIDLGLGSLRIETGSAHSLALQHVSGDLLLGPGTQATFHTTDDGLEGECDRGQLQLESVQANSQPWKISMPSGTLHLAQGSLNLLVQADTESIRASMDSHLDSPVVAWFDAGAWRHSWPQDGDLELVRGQAQEHALVQGPESLAQGERSPIAQPSAGAAPLPTLERTWSGRVLGPDGEPIPTFRLALLEPSVGHVYSSPNLRDFSSADGRFKWEDVPAGPHSGFVHAEGFALASLGSVNFDSEQNQPSAEIRLQRGGTLRGFVFDKQTKEPIAGARVMSQLDVPQNVVFIGPSRKPMWLPAATLSASDGSFELPHLSIGMHGLHVSAPGYSPDWKLSVRIEDELHIDGFQLSLQPGGEVHGVAIDAEGQPQPGAMVILSQMDQSSSLRPYYHQVFTDGEGRYVAPDLSPEMTLVVLIDPNQNIPQRVRPVLPQKGSRTRLDFIEKAQGTVLRGRVQDSKGHALSYTKLALFRQEELLQPETQRKFEATVSGPEGFYRFDELAPGDYLIMRVSEDNVSVQALGCARISGLPEQTLDLNLGDGSLSCTVIDARNGLPLAGADVTLWFRDSLNGLRNYGGNSRVDAGGSFEFEHLEPGEYWISAHSGNELGFALSDPVQLTSADSSQAIELQLNQGASLRIIVMDPEGQPVENCELQFLDENGPTNAFNTHARTNAMGVFEGQGLHPGSYQVLLSTPIHGEKSLSFDCSAGRTTRLSTILGVDD